MKREVVLSLIDDFLQDIKKFNVLFEKIYHRKDILRAWHEKVIPQYGKLSDSIEYELHGIGCCIIYPDREVDFGFGPNHQINGFDLWRLTRYSRSRKDILSITEEELAFEFNSLIKEGIIVNMVDSHLFKYNHA